MLGGRALVVYAGDRMPGLREEHGSSRTFLFGYAAAAAFVALAFVLAMMLRPILPIGPFLLAVLASAWFGGTGAGVFSIVLSVALLVFIVLPPWFELSTAIAPRMFAFTAGAVALIWASSR